jgi:hypothetical protein
VFARVAVWEPMPTDDRSWVLEAARSVPGVRETYHLVDPETGNGLSVGFYDSREAISAAHAAIEQRARESAGRTNPGRGRCRSRSTRCFGRRCPRIAMPAGVELTSAVLRAA